MGTNFYIHRASVVDGVAEVEKEHIGKRSGGWVFGFQGENCKTYQAWKDRLNNLQGNEQIVDEYGTPMTPTEMIETIEDTKKPWGPLKITPKDRRNLRPGDRTDRDWREGGFDFYNGEFC